MTPKEKAKELFDKYFDEMLSFGFYLTNRQISKIALIAVEEIKEAIFWHPFESPNFELEYWQEVKQEIENL